MVDNLYYFRGKDNTTVICTKSPQKSIYNIQNHLPHFMSFLLQYFSGVHKVWKLSCKHARLETVLGQHIIDEATGMAAAITSYFCSIKETCFICI